MSSSGGASLTAASADDAAASGALATATSTLCTSSLLVVVVLVLVAAFPVSTDAAAVIIGCIGVGSRGIKLRAVGSASTGLHRYFLALIAALGFCCTLLLSAALLASASALYPRNHLLAAATLTW